MGPLSIGAASVIAWLAWHTTALLSPLALLFPSLVFAQRTRIWATGVVLVYYALASLPVMQISSRYFVLAAVVPWTIATCILVAPWIVLWDCDRNQTWWRLPTALLLGTVPPIGIIGWASPFTPAGVLFPGLGWVGLLLAIASMTAIHLRPWSTIIAVGLLSLASNHLYQGARKPDWIAVNTTFGNIDRADNPSVDLSIAERIQEIALATRGRVIVFPEMVVRYWGESTDHFWEPTFYILRVRGSTVLIGARVPSPDSPGEYRNTIVVRGVDSVLEFQQRIPVPLAMWKPWSAKNGVPLNLFGPATLELAGERAAILICYEQLLPWSYLSAMWRRPTVLVGLSNAYWTKETVIPRNQSAALQAWGRLFNIPIISATNF